MKNLVLFLMTIPSYGTAILACFVILPVVIVPAVIIGFIFSASKISFKAGKEIADEILEIFN